MGSVGLVEVLMELELDRGRVVPTVPSGSFWKVERNQVPANG